MENPKRLIAPANAIHVLNSGNIPSEIVPRPMQNTSGNSIAVCPKAILMPANWFFLIFCVMFAANNGPGEITPESDTPTTMKKNEIKSSNICY